MLRTIREVFAFFFFLGRRSRKMKVFFLLSLLPVALAVLVRIAFAGRSSDVMPVFQEILMVYFLQFLIIILTLFYGTSVCSEEIEGKTLPYLTTRPLTKGGIIIGKFAAYTALSASMVLVSLAASYLIMSFEKLGEAATYGALLRYAGVLLLGLMAYMALFTFLGTFLRKSILVGLAFGFGWETAIQYFPGSTQRFSVVHYLKSLLPYYSAGKFSILMFRLEPTSPAGAVLVLLLITAGFLGLACLFFSLKEYMFED
ncbi:MAG: ABC transporter permease [Candidatus Aminicenantes bacterium]|nr:ABC transporter permease [Candidatus Aminicenantes bacterium]